MGQILSDGLALVGASLTFIMDNALLLTSVAIGLGAYGISVVKNAIR